MRPRVQNLLYFLLRGTWLVVGVCLGAVAVMLIDSNAELALDKSLAWGVAIGVALCVLAAFILIMLRPKEMDAPPPLPKEEVMQARETLAKVTASLNLTEGETNRLLDMGKQQAKGLAALSLRLWSGAAALGMAAAVAGSVIAMVTAFAAIRQVSRIDAQNALIEQQSNLLEQQVFEAQASRAANVFAAQLPSLLASIDEERASQANAKRLAELRAAIADAEFNHAEALLQGALPSEIERLDALHGVAVSNLDEYLRGFEGANPDLWVPSAALSARIQSVIDTAEPFLRIQEVDNAVASLNAISDANNATLQRNMSDLEFRLVRDDVGWIEPIPEMRFSPQRGQLLRLLIAAQIDIARVDPPFDFSSSDLRVLQLRAEKLGSSGIPVTLELGRTSFRRSSFLGATLGSVDLTEVDARGAVFDELRQLNFARTRRDLSGKEALMRMGITEDKNPYGTNLDDILIINDTFSLLAEQRGWLGNSVSIQLASFHLSEARELDLQIGARDLHLPGYFVDNLAAYSDIKVKANEGDFGVYRMGRAGLVQQVESFVVASVLPRMGHRRDQGDCDTLHRETAEIVRDADWYSHQANVHPKWRGIIEIAVAQAPEKDRRCFDTRWESDRSPPVFDDAVLSDSILK